MTTPIEDLVELTNRLAQPALDLAILGEGNTSIRADDESFFVKASGFSFTGADAGTFVQVQSETVLALLDESEVDEGQLKQTYAQAKVDQDDPRRPSVETIFHAYLLSLPGVSAVAHTHPAPVNALTCSQVWREAFAGRLFPDEAVVCGPETVLVPYIDPGVELAKAIRQEVEAYREKYDGAAPKQIIMQNHGLIACGAHAEEAFNITLMAVKAAKIRAGAIAAGGINYLGDSTTEHLLNRPDEKYRQALLNEG